MSVWEVNKIMFLVVQLGYFMFWNLAISHAHRIFLQIYILSHSLSLLSLSLFLSLSERKIFQVKPPNATRNNLMKCMECATLLLSDRFFKVYLKISHWFPADFFVLFLCLITIRFRCNYRN